tara:strand:+ start:6552 stop:7067 length:516 start_codon:yes stop_codon:yes gene_type:complete
MGWCGWEPRQAVLILSHYRMAEPHSKLSPSGHTIAVWTMRNIDSDSARLNDYIGLCSRLPPKEREGGWSLSKCPSGCRVTSDKSPPEDLETIRKRLRFRSWNRGMKETDLLLGRFADKHLQSFDSRQLALYEAILSENDPEILSWIAGREDLPAKHNNDVSKLLLKFKFYE